MQAAWPVGLMAALTACSAPLAPSCASGLGQPMLVFDLFFGEAIQGRADVTGAEWMEFVNATVAANLPEGYTVFDAAGEWTNPRTHRTVKEATKVLLVALPDSPASLAAVNSIRTAYQARFHQQLVGMTVEHACGTF